MKSPGLSNFALAAGLLVMNLAVSIVVFFVAMPLLIQAGDGNAPQTFAEVQRGAAILFFIAGTLLSFILAFGRRYMARRGVSLSETLDAVPHPCFILDENNAYVLINSEAERVLAISRERDAGKSVPRAIQTALAAAGKAAKGKTLDRETIVTLGGVRYQVLDNPISAREPDGGERSRLVVLRNVDAELHLRDSFKELVTAMTVLGNDTRNIVDSTTRLTKGAMAQDSSIATITSSLDEFSKKIQGNTESAAKGTQFAAQAREVAERSGGEIAHALSAMNEVQDVGVRIARIVKLIDDIAFQTNLLALNASVEAARAGRQGKGFAVVAEEVRNLAGRSARAAKDTASMVEDVTERIGNASSYMSRLEEMLRNIVQEAVRMADYSASAAATSAEQATAILQVNQDLGQINSITRTTCSAADETSSHVGGLEKKVGELLLRLERFTFDINETNESKPEYAGQPAEERSRQALSYGTSSADDDFVEPFRKIAAEKWDLHADNGTSPLPDLLRSDGYDREYSEFLRTSGTRGFSRLAGGPTEHRTNRDGDRIVRPEQKIHLDDAEFGRY